MSKKAKITKMTQCKQSKSIVLPQGASTDNELLVWSFDNIDRNGNFAFDVTRADFDHRLFVEKMIVYSCMSWAQIKAQTHDNGKSKNHLLDTECMSKVAKDRFIQMGLTEYSDSIFSLAFNNKLRIVGIRKGKEFHVLWYDKNHEVCPSVKKHT